MLCTACVTLAVNALYFVRRRLIPISPGIGSGSRLAEVGSPTGHGRQTTGYDLNSLNSTYAPPRRD